MNKLLSLVGSFTLVTSGATAAVLSTNLPTENTAIKENTTTVNLQDLTKKTDIKKVTLAQNYMFGWQVSAWIENSWTGNWHLELNHQLTQDIINYADDASAIVDWLKDQFKDLANEYPTIGSIISGGAWLANKVISWAKDKFEPNDKGNGVDIQFYAVVPWEVSSSNHNWNE